MPLVYTANNTTRPIIATAASDELRKLLSKKSGSSSKLARKTVEHQLKSYEKYLSAPRKSLFGIPSLVDALAEKIPESIEALDQIPDAILSQHIWGWSAISYSLFRQALTRLEASRPSKRQKADPEAVEAVKDIDEWILSHEKYLGDSERLGDDWHRGLITLADSDAVFPSSTKTDRARTIVRPTTFPGYSVLDSARAPKIDIQPSTAAFKRTFDALSDGLLKNLDWSNIIVAGGIVLGTLLSLDGAPSEIAAQWAPSDIDVYVYGLDPKAANAKLQHLFETFKANLPAGTPALVVRNAKTVTFYARYPLRRVQVVLKLVRSPRAVLLNFDLDVCAMGWDGSELWMLPRAARALETGYSVFTMNLIQGHYLSERRATQEQRVFKYANKGYGIRILPSYLASLDTAKSKLDDIARDENLFELDIDAIANASRKWTKTVVNELSQQGPISHLDLENKSQLSSEPQGRSCLTGLSLFMRHVALWEMEKRGELVIDEKEWASTEYGDSPESVLTYDDTPNVLMLVHIYAWGPEFKIPDFEHQIDKFNLRQVRDWLDEESFLEEHGLKEGGKELKDAVRLTYGPSAAAVLDRKHDITLPVLLPCDFAAFANKLVSEAQAVAGLKVEKILMPAIKKHKHLIVEPDSGDAKEGIFLWRIGSELMWQQLDRRIDEVFETLYAFYRAKDRSISEYQDVRLLSNLSKRAIRPTVEDEFDAFARWVGRRPIFVDQFFNRSVYLEFMNMQGGGSDEE
ncbi:hypothetical protein C8R43DRAFT_1243019 [Mycena crocata]|nr:hypothetical protein C8R43DRAFT_1243019 [Mycena crocata]